MFPLNSEPILVLSSVSQTELFADRYSRRRSLGPRGLRRVSAVSRLLGWWVRIPPEAWIFVSSECCVMLIDVCDVPIPRPEESYRVCVCTSLRVIRYDKTLLNLQRVGRRVQIEKKGRRDFRVVRSLSAHVRRAARRYVGKGGNIRNVLGLSRLFTELWAGSDEGSSWPASTLRAVLRCGDPRDSVSRFRYVF